MLKVSVGAYSDKGIKQENEDSYGAYLVEEPQLTHKGVAVVIADGMSGSDAGKEASNCCVTSFLNDYYSTPESWSVKMLAKRFFLLPTHGYIARGNSVTGQPKEWLAP